MLVVNPVRGGDQVYGPLITIRLIDDPVADTFLPGHPPQPVALVANLPVEGRLTWTREVLAFGVGEGDEGTAPLQDLTGVNRTAKGQHQATVGSHGELGVPEVEAIQGELRHRLPRAPSVLRDKDTSTAIRSVNMTISLAERAEELALEAHQVGEGTVRGVVPDPADVEQANLLCLGDRAQGECKNQGPEHGPTLTGSCRSRAWERRSNGVRRP